MRVTVKGQVTIPRKVRETLGITAHTEIQFVEENGKFYIITQVSSLKYHNN